MSTKLIEDKNNKKDVTIAHNKKRNIALISEFFIKYISQKLVEGKQDEAKRAINIFNKCFDKGTLLRNELRFISAIKDTTVKSKQAAYQILNEIKKAAKNTNIEKLEREKSKLIKEINYNFGKDFYEQRIQNYETMGTIHNLLNEYRGNGNIKNKVYIAQFEEDLAGHLMDASKNLSESSNLSVSLADKQKYNKHIIAIMKKKFDEKYSGKLNEHQMRILAAKVGLSNETLIDAIKGVKVKVRESIDILKKDKEITESNLAFNALQEVENYFNDNDMKIGSEQCVKCWFNASDFIKEAKKEEKK